MNTSLVVQIESDRRTAVGLVDDEGGLSWFKSVFVSIDCGLAITEVLVAMEYLADNFCYRS